MKKGAVAVGYLAIFNALGRVAWGLLSDRIGRTTAFVAMFVFQAVMMFLLVGMKTERSIAIAACIVGFNFGGNFALFPSATADLFGAKNIGANYGWVFTSYGIAGVVGIYAGNTAKTMTGSYQAAFVLAACLCALSAVLAIGLQVARKRIAARTA
jgi:OFA family oxalate/formate antiporter-like MFS transporter